MPETKVGALVVVLVSRVLRLLCVGVACSACDFQLVLNPVSPPGAVIALSGKAKL